MDFSNVLAGLNVYGGVSAIIGAGVLVAAVYFARWLVDIVSGFFNDDEEFGEDDPEGEREDYEAMGVCYECGGDLDGGTCATCGTD